MNVGTGLVLSLVYFLLNVSAATASTEPSRIVAGTAQSDSAAPWGLLLLPLLMTLPLLLRRFIELYRRRRREGSSQLHERIVAFVQADAMGEAIALLGRRPQFVAVPIYRAALARAHQPMAVLERGVRIAEMETKHKLEHGALLPALLSAVWAAIAIVAVAVGERELAIGAAIVFLGCILALTVLTVRRNQLVGDVELAALRMVDALESRFLAESAAEPPLFQEEGENQSVPAAAIPAYEEILDLPTEATS